MAKFINLKCEKCGSVFEFFSGQTKSFYNLSDVEKIEVERKAENYDSKLFDSIEKHGRICGGGLVLESHGWVD